MMALVLSESERTDGLPVSTMCRSLGLSRASFYRFSNVHVQAPGAPSEEDMCLRDQMQRIAVAHPAYGYRRMTVALRREGYAVNHKRVLKLMRADNLLCLRRHRFVVTTDSAHGLPLYPNLAAEIVPTAPNQLWVADITYIRLHQEFIYLAVLLDVFSRRAIGWELGRHLDAQLALSALEMALAHRRVGPGLVHHSDRGVQYASQLYTERLKEHGIAISMSRRGNPYDNAFAESFMKTLKYEEVYLQDYETLAHARFCIGEFIERVYNEKRLHSAIGYLPPAEFEQTFDYDTAITTQ